ncbi:MAG TPA: hypothetical protein ACFYD2_09090 [Candidatus Avalokitesvara rifleensis]|uniref:hypothetical protein n=1 Tax=Candidatus Avalokitesvara rifleensis TaxID=3367620 RepID=UPI0027124222|nr:hypothetical protein [Candidatus Brocadiales bacterium]
MNEINYFNLTGLLCVLIAGSILAGFPSAVKHTEKENTALFLGGDPYVKKNQIIREHEMRVGFCLLVLGTALQIVGLLTRRWISSWPPPCVGVFTGVLVVAMVLYVIPPLTYKWWSFPKIEAYFTEKYKGTFKDIETAIKNNNKDVDTTGLDTIGDILDTSRKEGESDDKKYLEQLRPFFSGESSKE